ncbi:hypothetical protein K474DRAFT_1679237 [Panus rudis PR-1116 ss-1]|nr:hypothetical protein K474DRAFT_1679237 [Panus rudis PR-1116 ss-1]
MVQLTHLLWLQVAAVRRRVWSSIRATLSEGLILSWCNTLFKKRLLFDHLGNHQSNSTSVARQLYGRENMVVATIWVTVVITRLDDDDFRVYPTRTISICLMDNALDASFPVQSANAWVCYVVRLVPKDEEPMPSGPVSRRVSAMHPKCIRRNQDDLREEDMNILTLQESSKTMHLTEAFPDAARISVYLHPWDGQISPRSSPESRRFKTKLTLDDKMDSKTIDTLNSTRR